MRRCSFLRHPRLRRVLAFIAISIAIACCVLAWLADLSGLGGLGRPTWQALCAWCAGHPGAPAGVAVVLMGAIVPMRHHLFRAALAAGLSLLVPKDLR